VVVVVVVVVVMEVVEGCTVQIQLLLRRLNQSPCLYHSTLSSLCKVSISSNSFTPCYISSRGLRIEQERPRTIPDMATTNNEDEDDWETVSPSIIVVVGADERRISRSRPKQEES
jgi:hypothetical protein